MRERRLMQGPVHPKRSTESLLYNIEALCKVGFAASNTSEDMDILSSLDTLFEWIGEMAAEAHETLLDERRAAS